MNLSDYGIGYDLCRVSPGFFGVWKLAAAFAEVGLRRRGPESLPNSTFVVCLLLVVDLVLKIAVLPLDTGASGLGMTLLVANVVLFLSFIYAVLTFFKLERRYRQTVSALLGVDIWVTLLVVPLALLALGFGADMYQFPFFWIRLALELWAVFIAAWVLARSLSQPLIVGFMFEILYLLTAFYISNALAPPTINLTTASS
jgi:hypothetical protein